MRYASLRDIETLSVRSSDWNLIQKPARHRVPAANINREQPKNAAINSKHSQDAALYLCVSRQVEDLRYTFYLNSKFYLHIFCDLVSHSEPPDLMSSKSRLYFPIVTDHNIALLGITSVF